MYVTLFSITLVKLQMVHYTRSFIKHIISQYTSISSISAFFLHSCNTKHFYL